MIYKVMKQYGRGADSLAAQFGDIDQAKAFIKEKLTEDARFKLKVTYRLLEGMDVIEEFTETDAEEVGGSNSSSAASGGAGQRSSFQPTPFNSTPRPAGMPHNWIKDEEDNKDDKK